MKRFVALALPALILVLTACVATGAPVGCLIPAQRQKIYFSEKLGFCTLYPSSFEAKTPTESEVILAGPIPASGPRAQLTIDIEDANGRSAEQVADQLIAAVGDANPRPKKGQLTFDNEKAFLVDGLPSPDPLRKIVIIRNNHLYTLTFVPLDSANADLQQLYKDVVVSFRFLPRNP